MSQRISGSFKQPASVLAVTLGSTLTLSAQPGAKNGEWRTWAGDPAATRYAPLDQIDAGNFNKLEVAWRFKTDNLGRIPDFNLFEWLFSPSPV